MVWWHQVHRHRQGGDLSPPTQAMLPPPLHRGHATRPTPLYTEAMLPPPSPLHRGHATHPTPSTPTRCDPPPYTKAMQPNPPPLHRGHATTDDVRGPCSARRHFALQHTASLALTVRTRRVSVSLVGPLVTASDPPPYHHHHVGHGRPAVPPPIRE
jgi:hypothetical protein